MRPLVMRPLLRPPAMRPLEKTARGRGEQTRGGTPPRPPRYLKSVRGLAVWEPALGPDPWPPTPPRRTGRGCKKPRGGWTVLSATLQVAFPAGSVATGQIRAPGMRAVRPEIERCRLWSQPFPWTCDRCRGQSQIRAAGIGICIEGLGSRV